MTKQNARREELRQQMFELFNEKVKTPRTVFSKFSVICGRVFFTNLYSGEDFVADFRDTDEPRIYVFDSGKEYPVTWSTFGDDVLAVCRRLWALFEESRALETVEDKQTQLDAVREEIKALSRELGDYTLFTHCTSTYLYAGFHFADENGVIEFRREGKKVRAIPTGLTTFVTSAGDNFPSYSDVPSFKQLPRTVRELIVRMSVIRSRLLNCQAIEQALMDAIAAEEKAAAPVVNNIHFEVLSVDAVDESEHDDGTPDEASLTVRATYEDAAGVTVVKDIADVCGLFFGRKRVSNHLPESLAAKLLDCSEDDARLSSVDLDAVERALQDAFTRSEPALPPLDMSNETNARNVALLSAPIEELEEYCYACTIRKTLAERVRERCQMEAGELPPYTPDSMSVCDRDLVDDITAAFDEIDASGVNELLKYADDSERLGRNAKADAYRQVAQLAALYAINDAIEEQPELEELLSELLDWDKPAQLPANIAAGISESFAAARRVFDVSCLSPDDLGERSRLESIDNWAIDSDFFRGMDDDFTRAFAIHPACGIWIEYFNQTWIFTSDGVVNACAGAFDSQATSFVETLRRHLSPEVDFLY